MNAQEYKRAIELYSDLRELPEGEWSAAVDSACAGNADLSAEVMRLLEGDRSASRRRFLDQPAIEDAAQLLDVQYGCLPEPGTLVGRYRIGARIGAGGMGVVYEARDERLERRIALKVLPLSSQPGAEERIRRFEREARVISQLNHPNIISIFDADFDRGCYFIAMEYVEGETLRSLIAPAVSDGRPRSRAGRLDNKAILEILTQTASALAAAHEAGIVHRDIKPENIMVRADGFVKVLDFGLAAIRDQPVDGKSVSLQTRPGHLAGTVQYLSPEQVAGKPATPRSDLFSLGVVVYELAAGVRPFDGPTDGMIFSAILNATPPPIGSELGPLVMEMLEKDPDLRIQTAHDLRSACRRLLRDSGSSAGVVIPSPPVGTRSGVLRVRDPLRRAFAAILAVACALFLFWYAWPQPTPRVTHISALTASKDLIFHFVNDGSRVYYAAGKEDPRVGMFQVAIAGGEPLEMPNLTGMFPLDISPDHSELLLGQYLQGTTNGPYPIWVASTLGSTPRRLGGIYATYARWAPGGDRILYSDGPELRIAQSDGTASRTIAKLTAEVFYPCWSPDGTRIRFALPEKSAQSIWEIRPDGTDLHMVLAHWEGRTGASGDWTPDGRYFVFSVHDRTTQDMWAMRERRSFLSRGASAVRLTAGPISADSPQVSSDGRHVLFRGSLKAGELVRYDARLDQWLPYLGGLAAKFVDFSRDGQWIAYANYPDGSLWRSRLDGRQRLRLTPPPLRVLNPFWSPDGQQIAFSADSPGNPARIYTVSSAGGEVRQWTPGNGGPGGEADADWSPDGSALVFSSRAQQGQVACALFKVNLHTGVIAGYPDSDNLWSPRWSPDGRYLAALERSSFTLWLYDPITHRRTQLTKTAVGWPTWSRDSRAIFFEDNATTGWYRLGLEDKKLRCLMPIQGLKFAEATFGWIGMTPDGSLISTRDAGSTQIYSLDWDLNASWLLK